MNIDTLVESFYKKAKDEDLINEVLQFLVQPLTEDKKGAASRDRVIRLPNLMATEITVGQKPGSEDRKQFELWMGNLGMSGDGGASAVAQKLKGLTNFFANPEANLKNATIPETLSYLMFLNQFVYMIKEFNASVAGFLWEPFLASLFGGESKQVPTSKGDIADIRIWQPGRGTEKNAPISLKILNAAGEVKGSFSDLVKHFAGTDEAPPGDEMRYIIVVKTQSGGKEKSVSAVTFYEFNITADNFFDWIGNVAYGETIETKKKSFKATRDSKQAWMKKVGGTDPRYSILHATHGISKKTGARTGKVGAAWVNIAFLNKEDNQYYINPEVAQEVNLRSHDGAPALEGLFDPNAVYIADVAERKAGGKGGTTMQKGYDKIPGTHTKDTNLLWGGAQELADWSDLATRIKEAGLPPSVFFQAVRGIDPSAELRSAGASDTSWPGHSAPGATKGSAEGGTQFHIKPAHYKGLGQKLGTLKITTQTTIKFFEAAAANMNEELVVMFNKLADLNDNIGRFFLANCGDGKACTDEDAANRTQAGQAAINDSKELESAVVKSVSGMK